MRLLRTSLLAMALVLCAVLPASAQTPSGPVKVLLKEWSVTPSLPAVAPGQVTFQVANQGTTEHELVVIKTDADPAALLLTSAGEVDEAAAGQEVIGEVEELAADASNSGTFELAPGRYVLICNIPGHYQLGMRTSFEVGPA